MKDMKKNYRQVDYNVRKPDVVGKYIITCESSNILKTIHTFETNFKITEKGEKSFDVSNQRVLFWLEEF
jgi:hypothetical protein